MKKFLRFNDWPMAVKLLVVMILLTLIPLVMVGFLNARNTSEALDESLDNRFEVLSDDASVFIANFLQEKVRLLESISLNDEVTGKIRERNASYGDDPAAVLGQLLELDYQWRLVDEEGNFLTRRVLSEDHSVNSVTPLLQSFRTNIPEFLDIFITDNQGALVSATSRVSDYHHANADWWQAAYNDGQGAIFISDPSFDVATNAFAVLVAVPIFSEGDQGELLGIARATVEIDSIVNEIASIRVGETGHGLMLTKDGEVIADPGIEVTGETADDLPEGTLQQLLADNATTFIAPDAEGHLSHFGVARLGSLDDETVVSADLRPSEIHLRDALDNLDWRIVIQQEEEEASAPVTSANRLAITTGVMAVLVAGLIAFGLSRLLTRQISNIQTLFGEIGIGNFNARAEVISGDELGEMASNLNVMLDNLLSLVQTQEERNRIQTAIMKLLNEVSGVADGDLTVQAEVTEDMTGAIADSFNFMIGQLRDIIATVQDATVRVSTSANELSSTAEFLSQGSEAQAAQIIETTAAIDEMSISIQQVSENASRSAEVASWALTNAQQGAQVVQETIVSMNRIREQVQETSKRIVRLSESSQEIGDIVQLISDIADRTSILALNASIQAAMAGEAGKGFAVVAEEVESLAERATQATRQITSIVKTIQSETNETAAAMEESQREVIEGAHLADQAGQALVEIETVSNELSGLIQTISQAARLQARGSEEVAYSMNEIAEVTQQTAEGTKLSAQSMQHLSGLADQLRTSVSTFKLPSQNGHVG